MLYSWGHYGSRFVHRNGVLIYVQQTGKIGTFNLVTFLVHLNVTVGLLAFVNFICMQLVLKLFPKVFNDHRYRDLVVEKGPFKLNNENNRKNLKKVRALQGAQNGEFQKDDVGWLFLPSEGEVKYNNGYIAWLDRDPDKQRRASPATARTVSKNLRQRHNGGEYTPKFSGLYTKVRAWPVEAWYKEVPADAPEHVTFPPQSPKSQPAKHAYGTFSQ